MIEGGIAGSVDLRTRLPFDQDGRVAVGNIESDYGDRSKKTTPEYSALLSDSFETSAGRFGLLGDFARSHVVTRTESVIMDKIDTYCSAGYGTSTAAIVSSNAAFRVRRIPSVVRDGPIFRMACENRGSTTIGSAPERRSRVSTRTTRRPSRSRCSTPTRSTRTLGSKTPATPSWTANYFGTPAFNPRGSTVLGPATGTSPLVFGANGMLQSGILTQGHGSFFGSWSGDPTDAINGGSAVPGEPFVNDCGDVDLRTLQDGLYFQDEGKTSRIARAHATTRSRSVEPQRSSAGGFRRPSTSMRRLSTTTSLSPAGQWPTTSTALGSDGIPTIKLLAGLERELCGGAASRTP